MSETHTRRASAANSAPLPRPATSTIPANNRTRVGNGNALFIGNIDPNTVRYRRYREILARHTEDLGGDLTEAQAQLLRHAALQELWAEIQAEQFVGGSDIDIATYASVGNSTRRHLETLGIKRQPRDIGVGTTLEQYVAATYGTEEQEEPEPQEDTSDYPLAGAAAPEPQPAPKPKKPEPPPERIEDMSL